MNCEGTPMQWELQHLKIDLDTDQSSKCYQNSRHENSFFLAPKTDLVSYSLQTGIMNIEDQAVQYFIHTANLCVFNNRI